MEVERANAQGLGSSVTIEDAEQAVRTLLRFCGENPDREGLAETPRRYVKALAELTSGYSQDAQAILSKRFNEPCSEAIVIGPIPFTSLCEHHILPFVGSVWVGYIPNGSVVGLSKIPRLVQCYARRLQIQERMTRQIAESIDRWLHPQGYGVVVKAHHMCLSMRGAKSNGYMTTSALGGAMRDSTRARAEFLSFVRRNADE